MPLARTPGPDRWPRESYSRKTLRVLLLTSILALSAQAAPLDPILLDPNIEKIVRDVSQEHIADTLKKLTSFETRGNFTDPAQEAAASVRLAAGSTTSCEATIRVSKFRSIRTRSRSRARASSATWRW